MCYNIAMKTVICQECGQDITDEIQVYPKPGEVLCEECNVRADNVVE